MTTSIAGRSRGAQQAANLPAPEPRAAVTSASRTAAISARGAEGTGLGSDWWRDAMVGDLPMREVLARRDVGAVFRHLRSRGWSAYAICWATNIPEHQVRAICAGRQVVRTYDVLERIAEGLGLPRGLMGLAYADPTDAPGPRRDGR